ncbi:16S rRNA processing protein RimM [Caldalkalibacillus uzonensis]|uniref:Ribosome maturation factor RimM n=1 Tax=Caldalkalibacillus uzonensis TaxID=353224 RepID=A0ABU0CM94_9BACI|nr:ribosome maturation factor RimM [Caldalkalibacillus uzonensis]MDQ0337529.1 16S rRNA processing protein RimM [Caldalkalibacillus uzonensis]
MTKYYTVGKIVNTHGIRGEVRVITVSDFKEQRYQPGNTLYYFVNHQQVDGKPLTVASHRTHKQFDLLTFEGHHTINDVEQYKGGLLKVPEDEREPLPEGEYYFDQIIGCQVVTDAGETLGTVETILTPGANDVWVVKAPGRKREILIPYIEDVVKEVDVDRKQITIHVIEGLLDE